MPICTCGLRRGTALAASLKVCLPANYSGVTIRSSQLVKSTGQVNYMSGE